MWSADGVQAERSRIVWFGVASPFARFVSGSAFAPSSLEALDATLRGTRTAVTYNVATCCKARLYDVEGPRDD